MFEIVSEMRYTLYGSIAVSKKSVNGGRMEYKPTYDELLQTVEKLRQNELRLESLLELSRMEDVSEEKIRQFALESVVSLTRSTAGYLHFYNEYNQSLDLMSWSKAVVKVCKADPARHYPLSSAGIWADCIRKRRPVVHNDYRAEPERKGYPEGHFEVVRHLSVPVFDMDKIVAVAGVGNKESDYDDQDIRQTMLFMNSMWSILKQKRAEVILRKYSFEDGLTGLANRRRFDEVIWIEWRRAFRSRESLALIMADIDFFKDYNDRYGHQAGDDCLKKVGESLRSRVRRSGELVARYGGEEFVIILPATDFEKAMAVAEGIRAAVHHLRMPHDFSGKGGYLSISAGVSAMVPDGGTGAEKLIKAADDELYRAKRSGRNCVRGARLSG